MTEPDIRRVEAALREHGGLSRRQAKALIARGWPALLDAAQAEADLMRLELDELRQALGAGTIKPLPPAA